MTGYSRRTFLRMGATLTAGGVLGGLSMVPLPAGADGTRRFTLAAAPSRVALGGPDNPQTRVWAYGDTVPGPEIRARRGERVEIVLNNGLDHATTVHWHGLRVPNAMDGVPHLTQSPVEPGASFTYAFELPDAGTYWYHPHLRSFEQVARGLYGAFIVDEDEPPAVDRDLTWILDDWRLGEDGAIVEDFAHMMDVTHAGRMGNWVTVNGGPPSKLEVRSGERLRLRLVNAANARIFALEFEGHAPRVIALDGQPVSPHAPQAPGGSDQALVVLAPGMRADVIVDMDGTAGEAFRVVDRAYARSSHVVADGRYADGPPLRENLRDDPIALAANPLPEPDLSDPLKSKMVFTGGAMGGMSGARLAGEDTLLDVRTLAGKGLIWALNDVVATSTTPPPFLTVPQGRTVVLAMENDTAWPHPIHLHGHVFRVLRRDGQETEHQEWRDTVLMMPGEKVDIAFVADNPGDWLFHCHILDHVAGGMLGVVRVG